MRFWHSSVNLDDLMDNRVGGFVRCDQLPAFCDVQVGMTISGGAWPENAEFPLLYDERDAKV